MKVFKKIALFSVAFCFSALSYAQGQIVWSDMPIHATLSQKGDTIYNRTYSLYDQEGRTRVIQCVETLAFDQSQNIIFNAAYLTSPVIYRINESRPITFGDPIHSQNPINPAGIFSIVNNTDGEIHVDCDYQAVTSANH